ncbi:MAG: magnesium and cobalt transport protein CorA [Propionibacteriaceae bacterium]|jgi:magnesium transporter|nr:magnesium and cobalt transport protein CorA [Propionibacteriaceae bacterium]
MRTLHTQPTWLDLSQPTHARLSNLAADLGLHDLLLEDLVTAHQRPKVERHGEWLFVVIHTARYLDVQEEVVFGELHVLTRSDKVVTISRGDTRAITAARKRLADDPELAGFGAEAILYAILDAAVDQYSPVVRGIAHDLEQIELQVFSGDEQASRRTWDLTGEVGDFGRAAGPLRDVTEALAAGFDKYQVPEALRAYLRDVDDHLTGVIDSIDKLRGRLRDIFTLNATLLGQRQFEELRTLAAAGQQENEAMKKISAWAAIIFAPSIIGGIYGMNFDYMPELHWQYGYPFALGLMVAATLALWALFKRKRWI